MSENNMEFDLGSENDVVSTDNALAVQDQHTSAAVVQQSRPSRFSGSLGIDDASQRDLEREGVIVGDLGEVKMSRIPIERFKASTNKISRIGLLSKRLIGIKYHYHDDCGSIVCFGGKCCELIGLPNARYLFPVVEYSTDNDGNIAGKKLNLRMLSAGEDLYKTIITIHSGCRAQGGIDFVDLLVTCTDDKYQKITLTPCGDAAWRMNENVAKKLADQWAQDSKFAYLAVARKVDEKSFMQLMSADGAGGENIPGTAGGIYSGNSAAATKDLSKFFED